MKKGYGSIILMGVDYMCTAMSLISKKNEVFFGRTMDFSFELDPQIYIVPKNYEWQSMVSSVRIKNKYQFIGTGQNIENIVFADGMNEMGLGVATLYFPEYAFYDTDVKKNKLSIAHLELVTYLLGNCATTEDVIKHISLVQLMGVKDSITNTIAPLHWIVSDKGGSTITLENTHNGMEICNNPIGVLANSPNFLWQYTNLRNYTNLSPIQKEESDWKNIILSPFGQGAGTYGLPGDYTSPSRFVKLAFEKSFLDFSDDREKTLMSCFRVMNAISIPKGVVVTKRDTFDYTQYTVFMNLNTGDYYFNTYLNCEIKKANINDNRTTQIISLGKLKQKIQINHI